MFDYLNFDKNAVYISIKLALTNGNEYKGREDVNTRL